MNKRYAILSEEGFVIEVVKSFHEAKARANANAHAAYVRPVDESESDASGNIVADFGNCHAFAIE